jgi:hypothetical protein
LDLFAKQTRVKGDGGKCGNGKDGTIRILIQNVFTGIAEFGQERDVVTGRSGGCQCRSMQDENVWFHFVTRREDEKIQLWITGDDLIDQVDVLEIYRLSNDVSRYKWIQAGSEKSPPISKQMTFPGNIVPLWKSLFKIACRFFSCPCYSNSEILRLFYVASPEKTFGCKT